MKGITFVLLFFFFGRIHRIMPAIRKLYWLIISEILIVCYCEYTLKSMSLDSNHPTIFKIVTFIFPDTASVHTHLGNSTANPDILKSALDLQSGKKKIKSASNPTMCG